MIEERRYKIAAIDRLRMGIDGDGVRTLVVFQNCSLRCKYCINPFTLEDNHQSEMLTAREIYDQVLQDRIYILATHGGVTFGGGEPLLQSGAIREFALLNKEAFSIVVETSLNVPVQNVMEVLPYVDQYFVDIKSMDPDIYHAYTGGNLERAFENLRLFLSEVGSERIIVRIPKIPNYNDEVDQTKSKNKLMEMGVTQFDFFDYVME